MSENAEPDQIPTTIETTRRLSINGPTLIRLLKSVGIEVPDDADIEWPDPDELNPALRSIIVKFAVSTTDSTPIKRVKPRTPSKA